MARPNAKASGYGLRISMARPNAKASGYGFRIFMVKN